MSFKELTPENLILKRSVFRIIRITGVCPICKQKVSEKGEENIQAKHKKECPLSRNEFYTHNIENQHESKI